MSGFTPAWQQGAVDLEKVTSSLSLCFRPWKMGCSWCTDGPGLRPSRSLTFCQGTWSSSPTLTLQTQPCDRAIRYNRNKDASVLNLGQEAWYISTCFHDLLPSPREGQVPWRKRETCEQRQVSLTKSNQLPFHTSKCNWDGQSQPAEPATRINNSEWIVTQQKPTSTGTISPAPATLLGCWEDQLKSFM